MLEENYKPPKTIEELLQRYADGERCFSNSDLDYQTHDLRNLNLIDIDLSYSFIFADFRGANLTGANFSCSNIKTCDFRGANLTNANFSNAAIDGTEFKGAIFNNTNFLDASIQGGLLKSGETPDWY